MYIQLSKLNKLFAFLLMLVLPSLAWSLSEDVEKPVNIEADTVSFDNEKGVADYQGNVVIVQGSLEIHANSVNIQAPDSEIDEIVALGSPVTLKQEMDDGQLVQGEGQKMVYQVKDKRMTLTGNAKLQQGKDIITNNFIEYLPNSGELRAGGKKGSGRVKAVFHPTNKVGESTPAKPASSTEEKPATSPAKQN